MGWPALLPPGVMLSVVPLLLLAVELFWQVSGRKIQSYCQSLTVIDSYCYSHYRSVKVAVAVIYRYSKRNFIVSQYKKSVTESDTGICSEFQGQSVTSSES